MAAESAQKLFSGIAMRVGKEVLPKGIPFRQARGDTVPIGKCLAETAWGWIVVWGLQKSAA
jgi:hypothetical protein